MNDLGLTLGKEYRLVIGEDPVEAPSIYLGSEEERFFFLCEDGGGLSKLCVGAMQIDSERIIIAEKDVVKREELTGTIYLDSISKSLGKRI